jgi:DNA-binding transcriptional regulator YiaG
MTPTEIRAARKSVKLTQRQAAELISAKERTWQDWERGRRNMPAAKWELFLIKSRRATWATTLLQK